MIYYFKSFGIDVPFLHLLVIITIISVITMIPVSLNGLGVREAGYVFIFPKYWGSRWNCLIRFIVVFLPRYDIKFNRRNILVNGKEGTNHEVIGQ